MGKDLGLEGVDESTKEVMKYLALKGDTGKKYVPTPIDVMECKHMWKNTKETTSSAMKQGTHFGHWKVGYSDDEIGNIHTAFANIPYLTGYSPRRW